MESRARGSKLRILTNSPVYLLFLVNVQPTTIAGVGSIEYGIDWLYNYDNETLLEKKSY